MSATILPFPRPPRDDQRLALLGSHLRDSYALPTRDPEIALLLQMAESLLSSMGDHGLCDRFLDRLDQWEREERAC